MVLLWEKQHPYKNVLSPLIHFLNIHLVHSSLGENNSEVQIKMYISKLLSGIMLK